MMATATRTRDRFLDAVDETYGALLTALEATEQRGHKVSARALEEARKGEKEIVALARRWADSPTNVYENLTAMIDVQFRAQQRVLELAHDALSGAAEYRTEVQEALRQVIKANRKAGDATAEAARETVSHAVEQVRARSPRPRSATASVRAANGVKET
jgi:hypothetical protein